ncbi:MAG: ATP-grasp domain-containing protein [Verrucomicrobiota bacterium]
MGSMQVFIQAKNGHPFSPTAQIAALGFAQRGWQIELVESLPDCFSAGTPLVGSVGWIERALAAQGVVSSCEDYPESLRHFLGRSISDGILGPCLIDSARWPLFVKPQKQKLFPGTAIREEADLRRIGNVPLSTPVWTAPLLSIETEYRVYILQQQVLASCRYVGPWSNLPNTKTISEMIFSFVNPPQAYCLDVGILSSGETILIEVTEILAASNYGLAPYLHSQAIEVRWAELMGGAIPEFTYPMTPPFLTRP